jgi:hypothetical protein
MTIVPLLPSKELSCCCVIFWLFSILALLVEKVAVVPSDSLTVNILADESYWVMVPVTRLGRLPAEGVPEVLALDPPLLAEEDPLLEEDEFVELLPPQAARAPVAMKRKKRTHAKVLILVRVTILSISSIFIVRLRLAKKILRVAEQ